jgi:hypothetical protein
MFEPVHGSAPDIAGKGIANPIGQIWSRRDDACSIWATRTRMDAILKAHRGRCCARAGPEGRRDLGGQAQHRPISAPRLPRWSRRHGRCGFEDFAVGQRFETPGATLSPRRRSSTSPSSTIRSPSISTGPGRRRAGPVRRADLQRPSRRWAVQFPADLPARADRRVRHGGRSAWDELRWQQPVRPGDTLKVVLSVLEVRESGLQTGPRLRHLRLRDLQPERREGDELHRRADRPADGRCDKDPSPPRGRGWTRSVRVRGAALSVRLPPHPAPPNLA